MCILLYWIKILMNSCISYSIGARHDISEILLKLTLNTIQLINQLIFTRDHGCDHMVV